MEVLADLTPDVAQGIVANLWAAQTSMMAAVALRVGELSEGDTYLADGCRDMAEWLTARFSMAPERAREVETVGTALRGLPHVATALDTATISWDQARALVLFVTPETDQEWAERAPSMSVAQLRREARLSKPPSDDDADTAREKRTLRFGRARNGNARLSAELPADEMATIRKCLEERADRYPRRDDGTYAPYGQRRADALHDLCDADLAREQDQDPRFGSRRLVTFNTDLDSPEPGIVEFIRNRGVRPVWDAYSHETLRRIACDADTRFAYVQQGKVIFTDARHRGPTPSQLLALWDRDGGCVHPGCRTKCHLHAHHIIHYENGGLTVLSNMVLLCSRHHHYHHEGGGNITGDPYAGLVFHRPNGTIIPNAPPGLDDQIRNAIWN
ncbi:MAG: DUF222 domain-containing protein [Acidimicrobiia bacterium]